jgi:hypothetical protein
MSIKKYDKGKKIRIKPSDGTLYVPSHRDSKITITYYGALSIRVL